MNGRTHLFYGFGFVMIVIGYLVWLGKTDINYAVPSLLAAGVGGSFGAFFPDFDIAFGIGHHRNTLTHSSILPVLLTISYAFSPDTTARTLLLFICIGMATHLLFDSFYGDTPKKYGNIVSRWGYRIVQFAKGNVGGAFKGNGADWANKHERTYLLLHSALCILCAVVLFWGIYNGIDLDWWFS